MQLKLATWSYQIAEKSIKCDALEMWFDLKLVMPELEKGVQTWWQAGKGIETGNQYIHYEFVDAETGEMLTMNCRKDMNAMMLKYQYYPKIIQYALSKYKLDSLSSGVIRGA